MIWMKWWKECIIKFANDTKLGGIEGRNKAVLMGWKNGWKMPELNLIEKLGQ